jgi:hypothetical protein
MLNREKQKLKKEIRQLELDRELFISKMENETDVEKFEELRRQCDFLNNRIECETNILDGIWSSHKKKVDKIEVVLK